MKKITLALVLSFLVFLSLTELSTYADASSAKVKEVNENKILLDDGTLWIKDSNAPTGYYKHKTNAVTMDNIVRNVFQHDSFGLTANGELISWTNDTSPTVDKNQSNIIQLSNYSYLKSDGTVWGVDGKQARNIKDAVIIDKFAYINKKGEIRTQESDYVYDTINDPNSIVSFLSFEDKLAYMDNKGKVVVYDGFSYDSEKEDLVQFSVVVTEDAASIRFHRTGAIIVTKKDGTAWISNPSESLSSRYLLAKQIPGIKDAVQVTDYYSTLVYDTSADKQKGSTLTDTSDRQVLQWLVKHKDGTWKIYRNNEAFTIEAPKVTGLTLTASSSNPLVGDSITFKTVQSYNNGHKEAVTGATLAFDKPYLIKAEKNGSYKVTAVGEVKVSVTLNGTTKSTTLSFSRGSVLNGAISKDNTTYLPVVSVFTALGGTVKNSDGKQFDIALGDTKLQLKLGQKKVTLNGKEITLDQPVQVLNGATVFPANLLAKASIAKLQWDSKYKRMKVSIGKATLMVNSSETAEIEKKEKLGTLSQYINKSYWVNRYGNWERFMKLTISDIVPVEDHFNILFKGSNGKTYSIDYLRKEFVASTLKDEQLFLAYDPYKKYNWSNSTWESIKGEKVKTGMNMAQVELSWGRPNSTSQISSKKFTVEVWRYGKQYVSFTNGIVQSLYSL